MCCLMIQDWKVSYTQQIMEVFELGSSELYWSKGRPSGNGSIDRVIGWADADDKAPGTEYDCDNDYRLVHVDAVNWFELKPGYFAIFFPEDAHAPLAGNTDLVKAVIKIKNQSE